MPDHIRRGRIVVLLALLFMIAAAGPLGIIAFFAELIGMAVYIAFATWIIAVIAWLLFHLWGHGL